MANTIQIGPYSLEKNQGDCNISIGFSNLNSNMGGYCNTSIGTNGGVNMINGSHNIFIGDNVSSNETDIKGDNNIIMGSNTSHGGFSNCIIMGSDAKATKNNHLVLGSSTHPILLNDATIVPPLLFTNGLKICINGVEYIIPLITPP